jgi:transposase-like protein
MLTPEAIARYVKHPYNCPYCQSENIGIIDRDSELDFISQKCKCQDCSKVWVEIYQLTDIEEGFT